MLMYISDMLSQPVIIINLKINCFLVINQSINQNCTTVLPFQIFTPTAHIIQLHQYLRSFSESHLSLMSHNKSNRERRAAGSWILASADFLIL